MSYQSNLYKKCRKYLAGIDSIEPKTVEKAPKEVKEFITEFAPARLQELAKMNCYAAEKIKNVLNEKYGEGNYVLIALGRSLASIAELMKKIGCETKTIPLSGLRSIEIGDFTISPSGKDKYKDYLKTIGLSGDIMRANPNKKYILTDYTHYGTTLENAYKLLNELLGEVPNFVRMPVKDILGTDYDKKGYSTLFQSSRFKDYSSVGRLPVKRIDEVYSQASEDTAEEYKGDFTRFIRKVFRFLTVNFYISGDYNIFSEKERYIIYKRRYSPDAVRKILKRANFAIKKHNET